MVFSRNTLRVDRVWELPCDGVVGVGREGSKAGGIMSALSEVLGDDCERAVMDTLAFYAELSNWDGEGGKTAAAKDGGRRARGLMATLGFLNTVREGAHESGYAECDMHGCEENPPKGKGTLEDQMRKAIEDEDYERAAMIRDQILRG